MKLCKTETKLSVSSYCKYGALYFHSAKLAGMTNDSKSRRGLIWDGKGEGESHCRWHRQHVGCRKQIMRQIHVCPRLAKII